MFLEKLHTLSAHAVCEYSEVCTTNQPKIVACKLQSVAPVEDHINDVLLNITNVPRDLFPVTSLASPSSEYHAA